MSLFATVDTLRALEGARAVVPLVGGYDGSPNFGDLLQLDAAAALVRRLGPRVAPVAILDAAHVRAHAAAYGARPDAPAAFFSAAEPPAGMVAAEPPAGLRCAAAYLYGGGYLNPDWGPHRLAMLDAAATLLAEAGVPLAGTVTSGLQLDAGWLAGGALDALGHAGPLGVRDPASAQAAAAAGRAARRTGDDAVGRLLPWAGARAAQERINVHVSRGAWVSDDADRTIAHVAAVATALGGEIQPVVAYDDDRAGERAALAALAERAGGARVAAPVLADARAPAALMEALARGRLTLSCSYHVALASLVAGVPAALIADTPYLRQKAAGLRADFGLPDAFELHAGDDPATAAAALRDALPAATEAVAAAAGPVATRRLEAERDVLGRLADLLVTAAAERLEADAPASVDPDAALALAFLRPELRRALVRAREAEREAEQARGAADEYRAAYRAETELRLLREHKLEVIASSRSWRLTGLARRAAARLRRRG